MRRIRRRGRLSALDARDQRIIDDLARANPVPLPVVTDEQGRTHFLEDVLRLEKQPRKRRRK